MGRQICASLVFFAAALALAGCASTPAAGGGNALASTGTPATATAKATNAASGYRTVVKNGQEYFCRREAITGSRTDTVETCLTQAQLDAQRANSQDLVRRLQQVPGSQSGMDSNGGMSNTAMGH